MQPSTVIASLAAATVLACTRPNPAFDDSDGAATASDAGPGTTAALTGLTQDPVTSSSASSTGSAITSSGAIEPTTSSTGASSTTSATTADLSSTTEAPLCAKIGEPCGVCCGCGVCADGVCAPDDSQCGPCSACQEAACVPAPADTSCTPPGPDTCSNKLWGLLDGDCFATAPLLGACDAQGACNASPCEQGEVLVDCDAACIKDPGECEAGEPVEFDAMKLCEFAGPTADCGTLCVYNINGSATFIKSCHAGLCQQDQMIPCGNYTCRDDLKGCQSSCKDSSDCLFSLVCVDKVCQAP
jgi:hypothetical protein